MFVTLQSGYPQSNYCPQSLEEAENALFKFLQTEAQIESLENLLKINFAKNPKDKVRPLTDETDKVICQLLKSNLHWLSDYKSYSFYTLNDNYFIVLYKLDTENNFELIEIPIINKEYMAVGSFISNY